MKRNKRNSKKISQIKANKLKKSRNNSKVKRKN